MKKAKRLKTKAKKKTKKQKKVRGYLNDVNFHCANLTATLRALADRLDDVRSFHLGKEKPSNG